MDAALLATLIKNVPLVIVYVCQTLGILCLAATVIARITKSKTDDAKVGKIVQKIWTVLSWLPTLGLNPKTRELQETYNTLVKEKEDNE